MLILKVKTVFGLILKFVEGTWGKLSGGGAFLFLHPKYD